MIGQYFMA